jgi:hypothetical protein
MPLPQWVGDRMTATYDIADSPWTAPGYRIVGKDHYTCIEPVDRIADRATLKAIQAFCPEAIPIWRKQTYIAPGEIKAFTVTHFGIAQHVKTPRHDAKLAYIEMPTNAKHPKPNRLVRIFEDIEHENVMHRGGPAPYQALDMNKYRELRADYVKEFQTPVEALDERLRRADEEKRRKALFELEEYLYRRRDIERFTQKQLEAPGDTVAALRQWRIKKRAEMLAKIRRMHPNAVIQGVR